MTHPKTAREHAKCLLSRGGLLGRTAAIFSIGATLSIQAVTLAGCSASWSDAAGSPDAGVSTTSASANLQEGRGGSSDVPGDEASSVGSDVVTIHSTATAATCGTFGACNHGKCPRGTGYTCDRNDCCEQVVCELDGWCGVAGACDRGYACGPTGCCQKCRSGVACHDHCTGDMACDSFGCCEHLGCFPGGRHCTHPSQCCSGVCPVPINGLPGYCR
jgi:hypothetical protein